ncbi:hypothetical protein ACFX2J_025306 [Malus domestica]
MKKQKSSFGQSKVKYLGNIVSRDGVAADPSKLQAIVDWLTPTNVKSLQGFLGLTGCYKKFILSYDKICQPLYQLTKMDGFLWSSSAQDAFSHLKQVMTSLQVLALPNFSIPFEIECDASRQGVGAVLQQQGRPITLSSQALGLRNQSLSTYKRKLIEIVYAVKKWHNYLQGRHFVIRTDHHILKYLLSNRAHTSFQQKWVTKLLGFDYEIHYKTRNDNLAADALSRMAGPIPLT